MKDTYLSEGIIYINSRYPALSGILKIAFDKGFIDNRKYNEFGFFLLSIKSDCLSDFVIGMQQFKGAKNET